MNKIKQILIGASILALSGSAAANIIKEDSKTLGYFDYADLVGEIIAGKYQDTSLDQRRSAKIAQRQSYIDIYQQRLATLNPSKRWEKLLKKKISRQQKHIATLITRMDINGRVPSGLLAINECIECGDHGGENGSVPEPSTIALLGMGLVGIGAARRLRKKAR